MEEFRSVKGYEGIYEVSNFGNVKSLKFGKERILKSGVDSTGYLVVGLTNNGKQKTRSIHQLVAIAFLGHEPCGLKLVVNHIDINPLNNNVTNLEIVTNRENANHKHLKSSSEYTGVSWERGNKKWRAQIYINGKIKYLGLFNCELAAAYSYNNALSKINNEKN
tara:strand:- start:1257 stop:1748 length:492 start_codon:yes stop_codon:yes gene_type:complete